MFAVSRATMKKRARSVSIRRQARASANAGGPEPISAADDARAAGAERRRSTPFPIRRPGVPSLLANAQARFSRLLASKRTVRTDSSKSSRNTSRGRFGKRRKSAGCVGELQASECGPLPSDADAADQIVSAIASYNASSVQIDGACRLRAAGREVANSTDVAAAEGLFGGPATVQAESSLGVSSPLSRSLSDASLGCSHMSADRASIPQTLPSAATRSFSPEVHVFMLDFAEILVGCCTCLRNGTPHIAEQRDPFLKLATELQLRGVLLTCPEQLVVSNLLRVFSNMQQEIFEKIGCNIASQYDVAAMELLARETELSPRLFHVVEAGHAEHSSGPSSTAAMQAAAQAADEEEAFWSPRSALSGSTSATSTAKRPPASKGATTPEKGKQALGLLGPILRGTKEFVLDPLTAKACENLLIFGVCELGRRSFQMCTSSCTADPPIASAFSDLLQVGFGVDVRDDSVWRALSHLVTVVTDQARHRLILHAPVHQ